jgi:hypothetical protein
MNGMLSVAITVALPRVVTVTVTEDTLSVDLEDGRTISVPIGWYPRLAHGTPVERLHFQISGAGYGIHWPDLDEDIGVEGLLLGKRSTESPTSFERWLQQRESRS